LATAIEEYEKYLDKSGLRQKKNVSNWRERLVEMLRESLLQKLTCENLSEEKLNAYAAEIAEHKRDPYTLVEEIIAQFRK
jgi:putative protein kinase ArgK-like GTPase of G3E family